MSTATDQKNLRSCRLSSGAAEVSYFDKASIFRGWGEIRLDDQLDAIAGRSFAAINTTTTVRNHLLENVILDGRTLLLLKDGCPIEDTAYFLPDGLTGSVSEDPAKLVQLDPAQEFVIGYNNAHVGYQHWLTECIPAIDWSLRQKCPRAQTLLLPHMQQWQRDFLELLGHGAVAWFTPEAGKQYRLRHASYSEFLNGKSSFGISLSVAETGARILAAVPPAPPLHKVLYIPCTNPYYGAIRNERQVVELLRRHAVLVVEPGKLSTVDRINLFRTADVIIGAHGEGLTDILFSRPGALLWEWMPRHHRNASYCYLAQSSAMDYWADCFQSGDGPALSWDVDLSILERRLTEISHRLSLKTPKGKPRSAGVKSQSSPAATTAARLALPSIDEVMGAFQNLGDNCEFGMVQRHALIEPMSLLRFAGIEVAGEFRVEQLLTALAWKFEGLGRAGTLSIIPDGEPGAREFIVRDSQYQLMYHTFITESESNLEAVLVRETKRLNFLRRKLLKDLETGRFIWVWKSIETPAVGDVERLLRVLRRFGPNRLLWVVQSDATHSSGMVERLDRDFIKGYVERFASYDDARDIHAASWLEVCQRVHELCYPALYARPHDN